MREDSGKRPSIKLWCNIGWVFHGGLKITGGRGAGEAGAIPYIRYYPTGLWTSTDEVSAVIVILHGKCCPIFEDNVTCTVCLDSLLHEILHSGSAWTMVPH